MTMLMINEKHLVYTSRQRIGFIDSCTGCCRHGNTWTFISQWLASCYRALCSSNRSKMFLMKQQGAIVALLAVLCAADAAALSSRFAASQQLALQDLGAPVRLLHMASKVDEM